MRRIIRRQASRDRARLATAPLSLAMAVFTTLAGCDRLFALGHVDDPARDAAAGADRDAPDDVVGDASLVDLVAWYKLDSLTTSRLALDEVAAHHAQCDVGACPSQTPGQLDGALMFDGSLQILKVPPFAAAETTSAFTVTAWAYRTADSAVPQCIVSKQFGPQMSNSWQLCVDAGGTRVYYQDTSEQALVGGPFPLQQWHHIAVRWDGSAISIFNDGNSAMSKTANVYFDASPITIGADIDATSTQAQWSGAIDDVRIYARALDPAEILDLATTP